MAEEKILTKHPQGKKGVNISKAKYDVIKATLLGCLEGKEMDHVELTRCVENNLKGKFEGAMNWYTEAVKLDLEANKVIKRTKKNGKDLYKLNG